MGVSRGMVGTEGGQVEGEGEVAEELRRGKTSTELTEFMEAHWEPIDKDAKAAGIDADVAGEFLEWRHAPERNAAILKLDPTNDAGSGWTPSSGETLYFMVSALARQPGFTNVSERSNPVKVVWP